MDNAVVKSVGRVFEVLELFDSVRKPLTATEVGRNLGYPASSTLALLKSMVKLGYMAFSRTNRLYFPTVRVSMLARWIENELFGEGRLMALLEDLRTKTGETVSLCLQNDLEMQLVHNLVGENFSIAMKAGETVPLFSTAVGIMALSDRPDKEIAKLVERHNRRSKGSQSKVDLAQLMQAVRRSRSQGYTIAHETHVAGISGIAFVLKPRTGGRSAVVCFVGLTHRIKAAEAAIIKIARSALKQFHAMA
ncbi:MAG: helix-turn-helix domain-containing protein [Rhodobacteraceae bacterium]|nr:helix-turn-helix domain-containing protein [Paracoccaceae bacterium]